MFIEVILLSFFFAFTIHFASGNNRCPNTFDQKVPKYHLIRTCYRSQQTVIARANYASLSSCQRLGVERRGLALNFSPPDIAGTVDYDEDEPFYSCEILKCPESVFGLSLVNDTRYDYYSLYASPLPNVNASCISAVGVFSLERRRVNYTDAAEECRRHNGSLADPSSDTRTNQLSTLLTTNSGDGVDAAFVGMRSSNGSSFMTSNGDPLDCTTYRAWAPGHPKKRLRDYSCVAVDRNKMWKVVKCDKKLPFICELNPNGPYAPGSLNLTRTNDTKTEEKINE